MNSVFHLHSHKLNKVDSSRQPIAASHQKWYTQSPITTCSDITSFIESIPQLKRRKLASERKEALANVVIEKVIKEIYVSSYVATDMKACASMDQSKKTNDMIDTNYEVFPTADKSNNDCSIVNVDAPPPSV